MSIDPYWRARAACRGMGPDLFYPERGAPSAESKAVCVDCPVRRECSEQGVDERFGVWGGLSERQRRAARRKMAPVAPEHGAALYRRGGCKCSVCRRAWADYQREHRWRAS